MRFLIALLLLAFGAMPTFAQTLTVTGQGTVQVQADRVEIRLGVETQAKGADAAVTENAQLMQTVLQALQARGVAKTDIQTTDFSINQMRDYDRNVLQGYAVLNTVKLRLHEQMKMGAILDAAVKAGANQFYGFAFLASDTGDTSDAALAAAVQNAQKRAAVMAAAAGVKLGAVLSINDSVAAAPFMARAMMADAAETPITTGQVSVNAKVQMVYQIVK